MPPTSPPIHAAFLERMRTSLGPDFPAFMEALEHPEEGLRVNTLRLSAEEFKRAAPFALTPAAFPPAAYVLAPGQRPGRHPYHAAGLYYLQDPGAMVVGALVNPRPGERVLDISAAPGGKTTHLAALMQGEGLLVANDVSASRAQELARNVERFGVGNAIVTAESPERLAAHFGAWFDRVLVDAPCSGESMFHKSAAARADWSPEAVLGCARRQDELLETAAGLVAPGGLLVYSTCTFSREENEGAVERFLPRHPDFHAEGLTAVPGGVPTPVGSQPEGALRLWPHRVAGAGHFVAGLRRGGEGNGGFVADRRVTPPPDTAMALLKRFWSETLPDQDTPHTDRLLHAGQHLYLLPTATPDLRSLRVLRSGLHLGTLERGRFEPSHALALAAPRPGFASIACLDLEDPRVERYLTGHPIVDDGRPGWTAVTVDGFALGWGKRVGSTIKNHYPKGLRQLGRG